MALKADHRLDDLLAAAGLARSTFFYHQAALSRPDPQAELKTAIVEAFAAGRGRYGHRRVHALLVRRGWRVAKKTVLKLMRQLRLRCHVRRRRRFQAWQGHSGTIADNVLSRDFTATAPNQKWVSDVTEFRVGDAKAYLSPVMDLFDHQIIAYSLGPSPNLALATTSLDKALAFQHIEPGLIVHTDQGFQYQHRAWTNRLALVGAVQSMSRRGNCYDNATMENFFGHLKAEAFHHEHPTTIADLHVMVEDYIHWWNTERIHTRLEGLSPVQYRAQTLVA